MRLDIKEWQEFKLSDLFDMKNGYFNNKPETIETLPSDNPIPFLGATAENNGVTDYCGIESIKLSDKTGQDDNTLEGKIFEGNCITITNDGSVCNAYYQPIKFTSSHSMTICTPNFELNYLRAMFICSIINGERYKWSYGRKLHDLNKSKNIIIKLPIRRDDEKKPIINKSLGYSDEGYVPDWEFMENYIKSLHHKPITTKIKNSTKKELNIKQWEWFSLDCLFDIKKGKRLTSEEQEDGPNNYVGAIDSNNGIANHISQAPIHKGNTISLSYNGSVGEAFYQREPYWATDDVNALYSKCSKFNMAIGLFFVTIIRLEKYKFSYGRKWTLENMNNTNIKLPIQRNKQGEPIIDDSHTYSERGYIPDWQFMEDYINSLPYSDRI